VPRQDEAGGAIHHIETLGMHIGCRDQAMWEDSVSNVRV
jgi:hypothetical protein